MRYTVKQTRKIKPVDSIGQRNLRSPTPKYSDRFPKGRIDLSLKEMSAMSYEDWNGLRQ